MKAQVVNLRASDCNFAGWCAWIQADWAGSRMIGTYRKNIFGMASF